jgi:glycerophosphoryl diester phosphodiesterase
MSPCTNFKVAFSSLVLLLFLGSTAWAKPWVVAHRGGTALGPENRLETFEKAIALGVDAIELDIHQSQDGYLMVIHDDSLDRTFGQSGRVDRMTLEELSKAGVPTLEEAIDTVKGRTRLVIEIKHPHDGSRHRGIEGRLVKLLKEKDLVDSAIVISFDRRSLIRVHDLEPRLSTGFLLRTPGYSMKKVKKEIGVTYVGPYFLLATPEFVARAHQAGLKVNPWTVNDVKVMRALIESGCDAITTNEPAELLGELKQEVAPSL